MKLCLECNKHYREEKDKCPDDGTKLVPVGNDPLIGKLIGDKYKVLCQAGKGSMSVVYKVIQESTGREMALKMLHQFLGSKEESVKRFLREAKAVATLHHTNIISLFDFGMMPDGQPYIVTEFLDGVTLAELIRKRGNLTVKEALPLMKQVCDGVAEAHKNRVIHRDLKPDNIVLQDVDLSKPRNSADLIPQNSVRVVDFGVAKMWGEAGQQSASLTMDGKVCGSPAYMSPEQCKGAKVDIRSDIYSLGVVFSEVLTGQRPFAADDLMALMLMHVNKEAPSIGAMSPDQTFPPGLSNVIIKALKKNPNDRHGSTKEFWREIESVCVGRRVNKMAKEEAESEPEDEWIPFDGGQGTTLSLEIEANPKKEWKLAPTPEEEAASRLDPNWREATTTQEPRVEKYSFPIKMHHVRAAVYVIVVVASVAWMIQFYAHWNESRIAVNLYNQGNFEGCIQVLEELKKSSELSSDLVAKLDDSYLKLGKKYVKSRDYKRALSCLGKVSAKSKFKKQSNQLLKRYKKYVQ